jgi:peptidoglycan hydrolase CwlO-like protein
MSNLALEKKKLDLRKIETSKLEFEYKILERLADIDRIKKSIEEQDKAIQKIKNEIEAMES